MENLKESSVSNCGKNILSGISKALGSSMNGIKLDEEDKISLMSSIVGLIISAVITKQVNFVISGRIFNAKNEMKDVEQEIEIIVNKMRGVASGTSEFKTLMNKLVELIENQMTLKKIIEAAQDTLRTNRAMWILSVVFGLISVMSTIGPIIMENMGNQTNTGIKSIFFGLSIGVGVGGLLTGVYSLLTGGGIPGVRFASLIGMGFSVAGIGASVYKEFIDRR